MPDKGKLLTNRMYPLMHLRKRAERLHWPFEVVSSTMATVQKVKSVHSTISCPWYQSELTIFQCSTSPIITTTTRMHFAHVKAWGESPKYLEGDTPAYPAPESGYTQIKVHGAALHSLVRLRISGKHYSAQTLPHMPGVDGVGRTSDGKDVYFFVFFLNCGSFAEIINIPKENVFPLPVGLDKLQVAAFVNPLMSSWMALRRRTSVLPPQFSVLILGATSLSGQLAIPIAKALGAGRVIGCSRSIEKVSNLDLDQFVCLEDLVTETDFSLLGEVDIILDYMYGEPAAHLLASLRSTRLVQYIQIGDLASRETILPSHVIRGKNLTMAGSGLGSFSMEELRAELPDMLVAMKELKPRELNIIPLSQVESRWNEVDSGRVVFVP